jgi:hypothetical protein
LTFHLVNLAWDGDFTPGAQLDLHIQSHFASGTRPNLVAADMDGQNICGDSSGSSSTSAATTTASPSTQGPTTTMTTTTEGPVDGSDCSNVVTVVTTDVNQHTTDLSVHLTPATNIESWVVNLVFRTSVDSVQSPMADVTGSGTAWQLVSKSWDGGIEAGQTLELLLTVRHVSSASCPPVVGVSFSGTDICMGNVRVNVYILIYESCSWFKTSLDSKH